LKIVPQSRRVYPAKLVRPAKQDDPNEVKIVDAGRKGTVSLISPKEGYIKVTQLGPYSQPFIFFVTYERPQ
jgi:hypothetical protein